VVSVVNGMVRFRFFRPQAKQVFLVGDFSNWNQLSMDKLIDGYWQLTLHLQSGVYKFRYMADRVWFTDFAAFGIDGLNSVVKV
jgi:1,4-alpha-glucan branching enzyme